eukprot:TRINITY_DN4887_c0_g4_i1.p1 TRINITY_DN4887_c0_g4~~TRINITY_DN4887_c0_g4_i1.p1  ORF type:complete len:448 (+),score=103.28 TRINITY_DN4887_c0_g4_i1:218-1561(+)
MSSLFCRRCRHPLKPDQSVLDSLPELIAATNVPWTEIYYDTFLRFFKDHPAAQSTQSTSQSPPSSSLSQSQSVALPKSESAVSSPNLRPVSVRERSIPESQRAQLPQELSHIPPEYLLEGLLTYAYDAYDVDLPVCKECLDTLEQHEFDRQLHNLWTLTDTYKAASKQIEQQQLDILEEDQFTAEMKKLQEEEEELSQQLRELGVERQKIEDDALDLQAKSKHLDLLSENYFEEMNEFKLEYSQFLRDRAAVQTKIAISTEELERLKSTNALNDVFSIWHDGVFGTINGFRLGRIPSIPVEWPEINAGLGQVVLLLDTISRKYDIEFTKYRVIPHGSFSRIARKDDERSSNELFGSSDLGIGRIFWARRFDEGLTWLLFCVSEIMVSLKKRGCSLQIPYPIVGETVGQICIRAQVNDDERWTKCLKFLLTDLKWIIAAIAQSSHLLS